MLLDDWLLAGAAVPEREGDGAVDGYFGVVDEGVPELLDLALGRRF